MSVQPISSIAFVGLGAMGAPMAENLVKKQFRVTGFDMREAAREALAAAGGHAAASAKAARIAMAVADFIFPRSR